MAQEDKFVLKDSLLPTQWTEGEERGAFWGAGHDGETLEEAENFHDHVAVVTVRDGQARKIDYFHSEAAALTAAIGGPMMLLLNAAEVDALQRLVDGADFSTEKQIIYNRLKAAFAGKGDV